MRNLRLIVVVGFVVLGALQLWQPQMRGGYGEASLLAAPLRVDQIDAHATWYSLCNGSNGACGDCSNTSLNAAWPHLDYTNCHLYCPNSPVPSLACSSKVTVSDLCPYKPSLEVEIHDCCTCNGSGGCGGLSRCSAEEWSTDDVVIDLTVASFVSLHGSINDGRIPVRVYYNY